MSNSIDQLAINTIRFLGVDAINKANSGHPGIVLGAAPMAHTLFTNFLTINSKQTKWINRDRFILSAGHGSMLLYALNHLSGYNVTMEDIKNFRQPGNTPGHPEYGHTEGVETTSGPLGQGISNAVGMAIAEKQLAAEFNETGFPIIDHYTYVLCGDGDLQEGVAQEAISLAGHLGLNKLIVLFDSNDIQLDGPTSWTVSENHKKRFESVGWAYQLVQDGNDIELIKKAINKAKKSNKPTLIEVKTEIGFGTPVAGSSKAHGSPIGEEFRHIAATNLDYTHKPFEVDEAVYDLYKKRVINRGKRAYNKWVKLSKDYQIQFPDKFQKLASYYHETYLVDYNELPRFEVGKDIPTRNASGDVLNALSKKFTNLIGGSADLTGSTKAKGADGHFSKENPLGRNINFGVREHAMGAIVNGITLHGGLKAFSGGFFVFADYMKPPIRLAALMGIPSIFVFSHDSLCVGEDGPTHQPVEQLTMLRAIPGLVTLRPADANETVQAWHYAISAKKPTVLVLTRQAVKNHSNFNPDFNKGAYVIAKEKGALDGILLATGSEVSLAIEVQQELEKENIFTRVVSMPSMELFDQQSRDYKNLVLPNVKTLAIEMASELPWYKYTKHVYGVSEFGLSAPQDVVVEKYGFTKEKVLLKYKEI